MRIFLIFLSLILLAGCSWTRNSLGSSANAEQATALAFQADDTFGRKLTNTDRRMLSEAEKQVLDFGKPGEKTEWQGADPTSAKGTVEVSSLFRVGRSNCRQFQHSVNSGSSVETVKGTACKRDDGTWRLVS